LILGHNIVPQPVVAKRLSENKYPVISILLNMWQRILLFVVSCDLITKLLTATVYAFLPINSVGQLVMTESRGVYVRNIPGDTTKTDLILAFSRLVRQAVSYVLFPLEQDPSRAYIQFAEIPG
jgi:hypothetical protein